MNMAHRKVNLMPGEYFHVYNRGNSKQKIFLDDEDKDRFMKLMYLSNSNQNINFRDQIVDAKINAWSFEKGRNIVSIGAWVLMPNHFHIYIISPEPISPEPGSGEESNIASFMRKLCGSYVKYFNKKYHRTGSLFEGRFKAVHIEDDVQAKYLFSYIHLNPIKLIQKDWKENGIKNKSEVIDFLKEYRYSSYLDYLGFNRDEGLLLNRGAFPNYFQTKDKLEKEIFEWLSYNDNTH